MKQSVVRSIVILVILMCVGVLLSAPAEELVALPGCIPPPTGLVSWWPWEGNGNDATGANPALLVNTPRFTTGKVGQSLLLDGSSNYARVPASTSLNVGAGNGMTIDAWIRPTEVIERPTGIPLAEWNTGSTIGAHLFVNAVDLVGNFYANLTDTSGGWHQITSLPNIINPNTYQHVALTYDRPSGLAVLYVNGVVVAQRVLGNFMPQTSYDLYFGLRANTGQLYSGQFDEIHLFNRTLSVAEIRDIYNADSAGLCPPNIPPVVNAGGPYTVYEGSSTLVTASGIDPVGGTLTFEWDLDNNGSFETQGQSAAFSAVVLDGPSNHTISVQVTNSGGLTAVAQTTVNVLNVAPIASFASVSGTVIEGEAATLAFSDQFDPSVADTTASFLYSYDCTNDGTFEIGSVAGALFACPYPDTGNFTARGRIEDKDGGFTDYTVNITIVTPAEAIQDIIDLVETFNLHQGINNSLDAKLDSAQQALEDMNQNNDIAAINSLQAFINAVEAQRAKSLTDAQADALVIVAQAIVDSLSA